MVHFINCFQRALHTTLKYRFGSFLIHSKLIFLPTKKHPSKVKPSLHTPMLQLMERHHPVQEKIPENPKGKWSEDSSFLLQEQPEPGPSTSPKQRRHYPICSTQHESQERVLCLLLSCTTFQANPARSSPKTTSALMTSLEKLQDWRLI